MPPSSSPHSRPRSAMLVPSLLLGSLLACSGGSGGGSFEINLVPVLPINQPGLISGLDELTLRIISADGEVDEHVLSSTSSGSRESFDKIPALEGARLELRGTVGTTLKAIGRTEPLEMSEGSLELPILVNALGDINWFENSDDRVAMGAMAAGGGGRFLLFGGNDQGPEGEDAWPDIWSLDLAPVDTGLKLRLLDAKMPEMEGGEAGRICHTATRLSQGGHGLVGRILVAGGAEKVFQGTSPELTTASATAFLFDPATDTIEALTEAEQLLKSRCAHTATELPSGRVVIAGGVRGTSPGNLTLLGGAEYFDPAARAFYKVDGSPEGSLLFHAAAPTSNGGVLLCGGIESSSGSQWRAVDTCDIISANGEFLPGPDLPKGLIHAAMAPLKDGRVLLTGGVDLDGSANIFNTSVPVTDGAWIYDGNGWTEVDPMTTPRAMHQLVALPSGDVLVIGGVAEIDSNFGLYWGSREAISCAELFDADTDRFAPIGTCDGGVGALPGAVALPQVALDPDFGVLISGGLSTSDSGSTATGFYAIAP